jgi:hypothetical protein
MTDLITPGRYYATPQRTTADDALGETSTGKEQVCIQLELRHGEGVPPGTILYWYGYFTDAALKMTFDAMRACGFKGHDVSDLSGIGDNEVIAVVTIDEWEGVKRNKVNFINSLGGGGIRNVMAPKAQKTFAARMKAKLAGLEALATPGRANAGDKEEVDSDDIPF